MTKMKRELTVELYPKIKEGTNIEGYCYYTYESWEDIDGPYFYQEWWSIYSDGTVDYFEYDSEYYELTGGNGRFDPSKYDVYANEMMGHNTSWKDELIQIIIV